MRYKNENTTALSTIAAIGMVGGALTSIISSVIYSQALDSYGVTLSELSVSAAWQAIGNGAFSIGALALIGFLVSNSFSYDLQFRLRDLKPQSKAETRDADSET